MPTKSKIAYLMHVDWNWIKQRPHFLYEELTRYYSVDLFYVNKLFDKHRKSIKNSWNVYSDSQVQKLKKVPLSGRLKSLQVMERLMNRKAILSLEKYDYIWITSPIILDFIPLEHLKGKFVIYDCMDDFLGFYPTASDLSRLSSLEVSLVASSDLMITSSIYLKKKMTSTYRDFIRSTPFIINNGISLGLLNSAKSSLKHERINEKGQKELNIMYIGTVGEWIDFDVIFYIINQFPKVHFTMVGPVDTKVPSHPRLNFLGMIEHEKLPFIANTADAYIMPFKLTELIRAVDPVKIYEYIFFHRPIFAIDYGEMQKFLPFIHLYSNEAELLDLIKDLQNDKIEMYSEVESIKFLHRNTWTSRCEQIVDILEGVLK